VLLCGYSPFRAQGTTALIAETKAAQIEFHARYWASISDAAKAFVRALLVADPAARPSAAQALADPWLTTHEPSAEHDLAGLREHFDPRARWGSVIAAIRAAGRLRRPRSAGSVSTASSGGWGGSESESDAEDDGAPRIGGGPPGENANVLVSAPTTPEGADAAEAGVARAQDYADMPTPRPDEAPDMPTPKHEAPDMPTPRPADDARPPMSPPTHSGIGAPPAPSSAHELKREDHPHIPTPLHEQSRTPTPIAETQARANAPEKVEAEKEYLASARPAPDAMPGSFHRSATEEETHEETHGHAAKGSGTWHSLMSKLHLRG
jgi:calcium/calmodulin-dependent protein kinase I